MCEALGSVPSIANRKHLQHDLLGLQPHQQDTMSFPDLSLPRLERLLECRWSLNLLEQAVSRPGWDELELPFGKHTDACWLPRASLGWRHTPEFSALQR